MFAFGCRDFQNLAGVDGVAFDVVACNQVGHIHVIAFGDIEQGIAAADFVGGRSTAVFRCGRSAGFGCLFLLFCPFGGQFGLAAALGGFLCRLFVFKLVRAAVGNGNGVAVFGQT